MDQASPPFYLVIFDGMIHLWFGFIIGFCGFVLVGYEHSFFLNYTFAEFFSKTSAQEFSIFVVSLPLLVINPIIVKKNYPFAKCIVTRDKILGWGYSIWGVHSDDRFKTITLSKETDYLYIGQKVFKYDVEYFVALHVRPINGAKGYNIRMELFDELETALKYAEEVVPKLNIQSKIYTSRRIMKMIGKKFPDKMRAFEIE